MNKDDTRDPTDRPKPSDLSSVELPELTDLPAFELPELTDLPAFDMPELTDLPELKRLDGESGEAEEETA